MRGERKDVLRIEEELHRKAEGSRLDQHIKLFWNEDPNHEYFHLNHPDAEWEAGLAHAEEIGLGSREYELIRI